MCSGVEQQQVPINRGYFGNCKISFSINSFIYYGVIS